MRSTTNATLLFLSDEDRFLKKGWRLWGDLIARFSRGADPGVMSSVAEACRINDQVAPAPDSLMLLKIAAVISI